MNSDEEKIQFFTDLNCWKEGHRLVIIIYELTKNFPKEEVYGLTNQIRRASVSITSNIAEGFSRQSYIDKTRFYSMAQGSNTELQNQLLIAKDVKYLNKENFEKLFNQSIVVHKLLNGIIKKSKLIHNS